MTQTSQIEGSETPPSQRRLSRGRDVVGALVLITLGSLLLMHNFGWLPLDFWRLTWKFWPVIFILLGLQTIMGGSWWGDALVLVVGAAIIYIVIAWTMGWPLPMEWGRGIRGGWPPGIREWEGLFDRRGFWR